MSEEAVVRIVMQGDASSGGGARSAGASVSTSAGGTSSQAIEAAQKTILEKIASSAEETKKILSGERDRQAEQREAAKGLNKYLGILATGGGLAGAAVAGGTVFGSKIKEAVASGMSAGLEKVATYVTNPIATATLAAQHGLPLAGKAASAAYDFLGPLGTAGLGVGLAGGLLAGTPLGPRGDNQERDPADIMYMVLKEMTEYGRPTAENTWIIAQDSKSQTDYLQKIYNVVATMYNDMNPVSQGMPAMSGAMNPFGAGTAELRGPMPAAAQTPSAGNPFGPNAPELRAGVPTPQEQLIEEQNKLYENLDRQTEEEELEIDMAEIAREVSANLGANPNAELHAPLAMHAHWDQRMRGGRGAWVHPVTKRILPGGIDDEPELHAHGGMVGHPGGPQGSDTVPAWLTPGEVVIPKPLVDFIRHSGENSGHMSGGGYVNYLARGGPGMAVGAVNFGVGMVQGYIDRAKIYAGSSSDPAVAISQLGDLASRAGQGLGTIVPVAGAVVTGMGEITKSFAGLMQEVDKTTERYGQYSPEIAQAQAIAEVRQSLGDIRRSQEVGGELARYVEQRSKVEQKIEDIKVGLLSKLMPSITKILELLERYLNSDLTKQGLDALALNLQMCANALNRIQNQLKINNEPEVLDPTTEILGSVNFEEGGNWVPRL